MAKACGCETVIECRAEDTADLLREGILSEQMTIIVPKCETGDMPVSNIK